jgi:pyruvate/2-oxoglutarate dehydrogenase complex dihydrolipoamide acyltransferase (E2) component
MRRRIAQHMVESKRTSPHVTTVFEVDLTAVVAHRERERHSAESQGVRLTLTAYFVARRWRAGLAQYPLLNARWTDEHIYAYKDVNVGIATATDEGLIVPVLKHAQDYNLIGLARQIEGLVKRARAQQLKPDDVTGGTFTLTNHGVSGSALRDAYPQPAAGGHPWGGGGGEACQGDQRRNCGAVMRPTSR